MSESASPVVVDLDGHVAHIRLNRPERKNAIDEDLITALIAAADDCATDPAVRAVVLSGAGGAFCAGLDLTLFQQFVDEAESGRQPFSNPGEPGSGIRDAGMFQAATRALRAVPVPVVAAVEGPAIGGGIQLAIACDMRIAGPDARFSAREIVYGITLDMGGTQLLPRLVGPDRAFEMIMSGRMVDAEEAYRVGLATQLSDAPVAAALELATTIAGWNPRAVIEAKRLHRLAEHEPIDAALPEELKVMAANIGSADQLEAVHAVFEKRRAQFHDRPS